MRKHKIAILGTEASFHHLAAQQLFGEDIMVNSCNSFEHVCENIVSNEADYGVMAIENLLTGSILTNYHLIQRYGLNIIGETTLSIELHLSGTENASIETIEKVISHPVALAQCSEIISKNAWSTGNSIDTTDGAVTVVNQNTSTLAAIVNEDTARLHELRILRRNVQNTNKNRTRFLVLSREKVRNPNANQACLSFELDHRHGTLRSILEIIEQFEINLTKIQSVPIAKSDETYSFILELSWENQSFDDCISLLEKETKNLSVLGTYIKNQIIS